MESKASVKSVRIAPRKVRLVIDLIRGKDVGTALSILEHTNKASSPVVKKLVISAIHNATHNFNMNEETLFIKEIRADEGPTLKRFRPRAQGRAFRINKRTSQISVILAERV